MGVYIFLSLCVICFGSRDLLIRCFQKHLDRNRDNIVDLHEMNDFLLHKTQGLLPKELIPHLTGTLIMNTCDLNKDNLLSMIDWSQRHACIKKKKYVAFFRDLCERLDKKINL